MGGQSARILPPYTRSPDPVQLPVNWMPLDAKHRERKHADERQKSAPTRMGRDMEEASDTESEEESEAEPAVCFGHALDERGRVFMELEWKDSGERSRGEVKGIMKLAYNRKKLEPTSRKPKILRAQNPVENATGSTVFFLGAFSTKF